VKTRRTAVVGVLIGAGLALTAACSTSTSSGTPTAVPTTTTPALSPAQQLTSAFAQLGTAGYDAKITQGNSSGTASVDNPNHSATVTLAASESGLQLHASATKIADKLWIKFDFGAALNRQAGIDPTKWMLVDPSKLKQDVLPFDLTGPDALQIAGVFTSVTNVTATDATHLAGTVDLTKAIGPNKPSKDDLSGAGSAAAAVPFTVTLDGQGRITELKITPDSAHPTLNMTATFSNYGSPSPITAPPAADVVPASPAIYGILNS
jgi:hypothetical protein